MIVVDQSYVVTALITAYNNLGNNQETLGIYSVGYLKQSKKINDSSHTPTDPALSCPMSLLKATSPPPGFLVFFSSNSSKY